MASCSKRSKSKQVTLESLKGVIVISEFQKISVSLKHCENLEAEVVIKLLNKIGQKYPTPQVIKSTGIGKRLTELCKHENKSISSLARQIKSTWVNRIVYLKTRKEIDVLCAPDVEIKRHKYRNILKEALAQKNVEKSEELSKQAEWKIFRMINKNASHPRYSKLMRLAVQKVTYRHEFVQQFVEDVELCMECLGKDTI